MKGVNSGSGQRPFRSSGEWEWINVDIQERWSPDIVADAESLPSLDDNSIDLVVMQHTLEHYGCNEGKGAVQEAYRIIRPGGSLIVCVPDMLKLARMLVSGELNEQLYMTNIYGAFMGDDADRHRWGFTRRSLVGFLMSCSPWMGAGEFDYREIPGADIARDARWILAVEVVK